MKLVFFVTCLVALLFSSALDAAKGFIIPKAFFTLDSEGHKSDIHPINDHITHYLKRLRRQVFSSSSSSSSSSSNGGPTYFSSHQTQSSNVPGIFGVPAPQAIPSFDISSRFGEDSSSTSGFAINNSGYSNPIVTGTFSHSSGIIDGNGQTHFTQTTGVVDETGKTHYQTTKN